MLKGWTLTDLHCDKCRITPLMREPSAPAQREARERVQFCALCDGGPMTSSTNLPSTSTFPIPTRNSATTPTFTSPEHTQIPATISSDDTASNISSLLLQGYSLLSSNCPNSTCRGIPLVGYPRRKDGMKDSRRLCVGCGGRWVSEGDLGGMRLMEQPQSQSSSHDMVTASGSNDGIAATMLEKRQVDELDGGSPRTRRRREMYGLFTTGKDPLDKGKSTRINYVDREEQEEENNEESKDMDVDGSRMGSSFPMQDTAAVSEMSRGSNHVDALTK